MTYEEAYKNLKDYVKVCEDGYRTYLENGGESDVGEELFIDVCWMAVEALKKQIPKKHQSLMMAYVIAQAVGIMKDTKIGTISCCLTKNTVIVVDKQYLGRTNNGHQI